MVSSCLISPHFLPSDPWLYTQQLIVSVCRLRLVATELPEVAWISIQGVV
jgi:hypothetical protein